MKPVDVGGRTHDHVRFVRCSLTGTNDDHPRVRKLHHRELARQLEHHIPTHQLTVEAGSLPDVARAIFLSQRSVTEAGYLNREIALALEQAEMQPEREIFIIPIRLEECTVPDRLTHLHWFELPETGFSVGQAYLRLQRSLVVRAMQAGRMQSGDLSQPWMEHMLYQKTIPDAYPVEDLEGQYLVRGSNPDESKYYGIASIDSSGGAFTLVQQIGIHQVRYEGQLEGSRLIFSGSDYTVTYAVGRNDGVLLGEWGEGGIEELIPAGPFASAPTRSRGAGQ